MLLRRSVLALLVLALPLAGQTRTEPRQVRLWAQLCHVGGAGTCLPMRQVRMDDKARATWEKAARLPTYAQYRVAVVKTQDLPILITCGPSGRGCASHFPLWFDAPILPF